MVNKVNINGLCGALSTKKSELIFATFGWK